MWQYNMSLSGTSGNVRAMSLIRYIWPGRRWGTRRSAMVSAAEGDGATARMCTSSCFTSCRIASITVLVFPVPGGP